VNDTVIKDDIEVPVDIEDQVCKLLDQHPHLRWDDAVYLVLDGGKLQDIEAKKTKSKEEAGDFSESWREDDDTTTTGTDASTPRSPTRRRW
jgi:hypothetical protein